MFCAPRRLSRFHSHRASSLRLDCGGGEGVVPRSRSHSHRASIATYRIRKMRASTLCLDPTAIEHRSRLHADHDGHQREHASRSHSHRASIATTGIPSESDRVRRVVSIPQSSSIDRDTMHAARCDEEKQLSRFHSHRASIAMHILPGDVLGHRVRRLDSTDIEYRSRPAPFVAEQDSANRCLDSTDIEHRSRPPFSVSAPSHSGLSRFHSHRASIATTSERCTALLTPVSIPQSSSIDRDATEP